MRDQVEAALASARRTGWDGLRSSQRAYLKDVRLDVSQVAYLLGYSELRAFDRAFRRWANKSPSEWRSET